MFKKVLIAEDIDALSAVLQQLLETLGVKTVDQVQYCDDAYLRMLRASKEGEPYDLLITDLSFKEDHRKQKISSGEELAKTIKKEFPGTKVIVYSIEDRLERVRYFLNDLKLDGYVCKGRQGLKDLEESIPKVFKGHIYIPPTLRFQFNNPSSLELTDTDILILKLLSEGNSQDQISKKLRAKNITPSSLSSIEKRLSILKNNFGAANSINLIAIVKDLGLI